MQRISGAAGRVSRRRDLHGQQFSLEADSQEGALCRVDGSDVTRHLFSDNELEAIRAHVPWTRIVRDEQTDYFGREVNLLEFIRADGERLVLKPNDDYGGHGITIGWNVDQRGWDEAINNALADGDYLVQERVPTARETFPALTDDGRIEFAEQLVDLDPLLFNGKVGSAFTRLSFTELANVSSGGGMVPTYIISKK